MVENSFPDELESHQEASRAPVAVCERVDRLELVVSEGDSDQAFVWTSLSKVGVEVIQAVDYVKRGRWDEASIIRHKNGSVCDVRLPTP